MRAERPRRRAPLVVGIVTMLSALPGAPALGRPAKETDQQVQVWYDLNHTHEPAGDAE